MKKIIVLLFILSPLVTFGTTTASDYQLLEPLPCIQNTGQGETEQKCADGVLLKKINTDTYIAYVFNFSIAFAAVAAVIVIIYAGFEYATSDILTSKSDARNRIYNAIWGLITIICSYFILNVIDPRLVDINTQLEPITIVGEAFDYDAILNDAIGYKIVTDSRNANAQVKALTKEAEDLRKLAAQYEDTDSNKFQEYSDQALQTEREAKWIGSSISLQSIASLSERTTDMIEGYNDKFITPEQQSDLDARKASINSSAESNIKEMINMGDITGAQKLEEERLYYITKIDQDILIKQQQNLMSDTIEYNNGIGREGGLVNTIPIIRLKNYAQDVFSGIPSNLHQKNQEAAIRKLQDSPIPDGLSPERKKELKVTRDVAISQIRALPDPKR